MTLEPPDWLVVKRGEAPLVVTVPHAGVELARLKPVFADPWLARKDADRRLDELYDFVEPLGATSDPAFALDHRCQSRSERSLALSQSGDDRTRPDNYIRRQAALSGRVIAGRGRDR
jgi:hypothetical protein